MTRKYDSWDKVLAGLVADGTLCESPFGEETEVERWGGSYAPPPILEDEDITAVMPAETIERAQKRCRGVR